MPIRILLVSFVSAVIFIVEFMKTSLHQVKEATILQS